ncbi:MAG TPA: VOC family protein [Acetobacteraceae bacterium]|nr:VOC family protein [Acetobacteraceae bacterium]
MSDHHGQFVWCELMTTDADAATDFYTRVVGWTAADSGMPDKRYTILSAGDTRIGGVMELPRSVLERGARPGWVGYIAARDVDAAAARVRDAGGAIHHGPEDIPGIGRFAVVQDPQGAVFTLFRAADGGAAPPPAAAMPGHVGWHELRAADSEAAFAFYADLFGWTRAEAFDMGPMGTYQLFAPAGGRAIGGMMTRPDPADRPSWGHVFNVEGIDAASSRVAEAGGRVTDGPHEVPGGAWVVRCTDPQDVTFALVAPVR